MIKHPPLTAKSIIASTRNFIQWVGKDRLEQQIDKMIKQEVAGLQAEIATLQMCAIAGEAMGVEMLKLETQKEQMIKDIRRLRGALLELDGCPLLLDEATVPKGKAPNDPTNPPYQVVCNMSVSYTRIENMKQALDATDRPEYKEEG